MAAPEESNFNWLVDLELEGISLPGGGSGSGGDMFPPIEPAFQWPSNAFSVPTSLSNGQDVSDENSNIVKQCNSKKRVRSEACNTTESKAHREKMRRDRLNDRFQELSSVIDPGKPPKMDKSAILSDAVKVVNQLRDEAKKLKVSFQDLQEKVNELKAEKNELREEKQKLKAEKEKLELQLKAISSQPAGFLAPHHPASVLGSKMIPFAGYPAGMIPMWQFVPSEDHSLRSPMA
ncbi:hypothetical protein DM860_003606 [Cuscuta australis]|uniref:BHLH domain-containing protein n=1 Tax=Cuscuta australis TaxID=267555 RepID=A0A328DGK0_9ASTE|nr:hypothetical protein DM860_003606 [Cuscuta australis]